MYVYPSHHYYVNMAIFGKVEIHLSKHRKVGEAVNAPVEIVYTKDERYLYPAGTPMSNSDCSATTLHNKPSPDRLRQMSEHEAIGKKDEEKVKKDWHVNLQLLTRSQ